MRGAYRTGAAVRFAHCDTAGIAYYPRLLELADGAVEDWTEAVLGVSRAVMHGELGFGLPTVEIVSRFTAPCRMGEGLIFDIAVADVGRRSVRLRIEATASGVPRFAIDQTLALMALRTARSVSWPTEWRARLEAEFERRAA